MGEARPSSSPAARRGTAARGILCGGWAAGGTCWSGVRGQPKIVVRPEEPSELWRRLPAPWRYRAPNLSRCKPELKTVPTRCRWPPGSSPSPRSAQKTGAEPPKVLLRRPLRRVKFAQRRLRVFPMGAGGMRTLTSPRRCQGATGGWYRRSQCNHRQSATRTLGPHFIFYLLVNTPFATCHAISARPRISPEGTQHDPSARKSKPAV